MARVGQQVVAGAEERLPARIAVGVLMTVFPPGLVDEVVAACGVAEQRFRKLPARLVVYYALAMTVFFQSSYGEVWSKLVSGLDWAKSFRERLATGMQPSPAAISKARGRLGWQVMAALLAKVAGPQAGEEHEWAYVAGLRLVAIDGVVLDVPATEDNGREFGYPGNDAGDGPFPQVRVVAVAECGSRAVMGAAVGGLDVGEQGLTRDLLPILGPGMLSVSDRNFLSHALLEATLATGAHVLWRAKADTDLPVLKILSDGTYLSRIAYPKASARLRRKGTSGADIPGSTVRVIEYSVTTNDGSGVSELFCLVTDLLDPQELTPIQAAEAYHQRWQLETALEELETGIRGGLDIVLRSKSPNMIRQEIYALLCTYQAIRTLICHTANAAGLDPDRISFTRAKESISRRVSDDAAFPPCELDDLLADLTHEITYPPHLVPQRPPRSYVRCQKDPTADTPPRKPRTRHPAPHKSRSSFGSSPCQLKLMPLHHSHSAAMIAGVDGRHFGEPWNVHRNFRVVTFGALPVGIVLGPQEPRDVVLAEIRVSSRKCAEYRP